jgi:site-specific DNA recombinase
MTKAIIYCRFSDRRDAANCQSNEMQRDLCGAYCEKQGHEIVGTLLDDAVSGAEEDRPVLWRAIALLKKGMVLVVYKTDRLARNVYLHEYIYREVKKKKATIEVVEGCRNGDSAEDELVRTIFAAFAQYERKIIAARTKAATLRHMANGIAIGKDPPYGKQAGPVREIGGKMRRTVVDCPAEQEIIELILRLRERPMAMREIARHLNDTNVDARGREWNHVTISRILARSDRDSQSETILVAPDAPGIAPTGPVEV